MTFDIRDAFSLFCAGLVTAVGVFQVAEHRWKWAAASFGLAAFNVVLALH